MAKVSKLEQAQAAESVRDAIGISPDTAAQWIAAYEARDKARNARATASIEQRREWAKIERPTETMTAEELKATNQRIKRMHPMPVSDKEMKRLESEFEAIDSAIKRNRRIHCIVTHVARSGMSRRIRLLSLRDERPLHLSYNSARAMGRNCSDNSDGVRIDGCGMDMGFALVSDLSYTLYGNAYLLKHEWL